MRSLKRNNKVKIAIAFFGLPRNSSVCFPSIQDKLYTSVNNFEVKSFYHLYKQKDVVNKRSGENDELLESNYKFFDEMVGVLEDPGLCLPLWGFEEIKKLGDTWNDDYSSIKNLIHQLNSLYQVTSLIKGSEYDPDVVIFIRPDLFYHDSLPMYSLVGAYKEPRTVYIPGWQWWNGLNDRFSICGKESYFAYGSRIVLAKEFCLSNNRGIHSERLLKYSLVKSRTRIKFLNCTASRVRVSGLVVDEEFSSNKSMGKRENRFTLPIAKFRAWVDKIKY